MPYTAAEQKRLKALITGVEKRKSHQYAAPTYEDSAALAEISAIASTKLSDCDCKDSETLEDSVAVLRYIANSYESMNRVAYAVRAFNLLLLTEIESITRFSADKSRLADDLYSAVRARNYYVQDRCDDLADIAATVLGKAETEKTIDDICRNYPHIKRDSVELTEPYLAVIDDVERKISGAKKTDVCHEYWKLKKQFLAGYGIKWRSPSELNPRILFD